MSKCGKGCMPECKYFTTSGCISPFNCMYKEESGYINSATSGTVIYTGGMNMTNEEMIENLKCVIADIFEQCEQLKAENAALRERLSKAVELPCKIGDKFYVVNYYPPELNEEECCDFSFIELSKILLDNGCGVTYELGDNGCFFVTLDKNEAIRIYNQKKEEQND